MDIATILKLVAWGICVAVALQVVFYFVFQVIGYNSYLLSMTLLVSLIIAWMLFAGWKILKKAIR